MKHIYCPRGKVCAYVYAISLLLALPWYGSLVRAQDNLTVQGRVLSAVDNEALPGASVQVRGSNQGTITDRNGSFSFTVTGSSANLRVSFIGYRTIDTTLTLPLKKELLLVLSQDANVLEGVTVSTGYWETSRRLSTGNIAKVTASEINNQPVGNLLTALQGRVAGLVVTPASGLPGSHHTISIRGLNSIGSGNEPLFIVDGIPFIGNSLSQINGAAGQQSPFVNIAPGDIEAIEVLKDADATAIYGSRGANGVILITTKRASTGKPTFDLEISGGAGRTLNTMTLMNTQQYLQMRREAFRNDGLQPNAANAADLLTWNPEHYTDWKKLLIGNTAFIGDIRAAFSAGANGNYMRLSGGYRKETNVFPGQLGDQRMSLQLYSGHVSKDNKIRLDFSSQYALYQSNSVPQDLTGSIFAAPNMPVGSDGGGGALEGLLSLRRKYRTASHNLINNLVLTYKPVNGLSLKLNAGFNRMQMDETSVFPKESYEIPRESGNSNFGTSRVSGWILEPQASYVFSKADHKWEVMAGATFQETLNNRNTIAASGFSSEALLESPAAASETAITQNTSQYRYASLLGRINYTFRYRYVLNLTGRRDGSSRFGPENRFANFGAVGAAWLFGEEKWMNGLRFLSSGKLRASYGLTGNDRIGDYQYLDTYGSTQYPYQGVSGLLPTKLFNPVYGWETNKKLEWALEMGFLKDKLRVSVARYQNRSGNQLLTYPLPSQTGFAGITRNLPATVLNSGWEIEMQTHLSKGDFSWGASLNFSIVKNKLLAFPDLENSSYASRYQVGHSLQIRKVYHYTGVDPQTGIWQVDMDADRSAIVDLTPKYYGGLSQNLKWRRWEMDLFFRFSRGWVHNYLYSLPAAPGLRGYNMPVTLLNRWQKAGDQTDIQKFTTGSTDASRAYGTYFTNSDGAYTLMHMLRLGNLSVSYTFPAIGKPGKTKTFKTQLRCQNLFTITNYEGNDPEVTYLGFLPPMRMVTAGIQLKF
ncbi:TonB-dependent receptor [Ravibacter arvi]|uniref:TonB-dependent receptor n=1 Tax=Ravibacter arvi TaxID=2051041 RepID=A0ABP8LTH2_9BACT